MMNWQGRGWQPYGTVYQGGKQFLNMPGNGAIGIATLRLDGWVSIDAGAQEGTLTTKPLVLEGKTLIVNVQASQGAMAVEILDRAGRPLSGFGRSDCNIFSGDAVRHRISWQGRSNLQEFAGKTVRLRFYLRNAKLYSFIFQ